MGYYSSYPAYVSVGEKKLKAAKKLKELQKRNPGIKPIIIEGNTIASSWWGKAWNRNLERYADYSNRIGRGRSYLRNGAVLDLQIEPGNVKSLVQGSTSTPYSVEVKIDSIKKTVWENIKNACKGKLDSLSELLTGKFPKQLDVIFTEEGVGLFPLPGEIKFDCSCPDGASMCKHVAATLYGVGTRLDEEPNLFFKLRKVDVNVLITETIKDKTGELIKKAGKKSSRVIDDSDLSSVFGIEIDTPVTKTAASKKVSAQKKVAPSKKPLKKPLKQVVSSKKPLKKVSAQKKVAPSKKPLKKAATSKKGTKKDVSIKSAVKKVLQKKPKKSVIAKPKAVKKSTIKTKVTDKKPVSIKKKVVKTGTVGKLKIKAKKPAKKTPK